jgi:hypothetical protein
MVEDTTLLSVTKTMADPKATDTRLESLEKSIHKLLISQDKTEDERTGGEDEDEKDANHGKDQSPEEKDNQGQEGEQNATRK